MLRVRAVDSHTEGMPTRVITDGVGELPGTTMLQRKLGFEAERDGLRRLLMCEPRGHGAMSGAILQRPCRADADWGVVFIEVSGCLPMCGHGTIGVATVLVEERLVDVVEPVTTIRLDVPAGLVEARVQVVEGHARAVTIDNVASFAVALGARASGLAYDMAYGGNFYAIADAAQWGLRVAPDAAGELIAAGLELMAAVPEPVHPLDPEIRGCHHVIWTAPPGDGAGPGPGPGLGGRADPRPAGPDGRADPRPGAGLGGRADPRPGAGLGGLADPRPARGATAIHPGWLDRSPCGTGTSARMAALHARGELALDTPFVHESIIGTRFTGRLIGETTVGDIPAVRPQITGRAWITGRAEYVLDPTDPFPEGFVLG